VGKLESTIKSEIERLAKREVRATFLPIRREVWGMKLKLSNLLKNFTVVNRAVREQAKQYEEKKLTLEASPEEVKASRLTPGRIRNLRKKLGISQRELGILTDVTTGAVLSWEKGKFKPKGEKKAALVALRKLRKLDVRKMLAEKSGAKDKGKNPKKGKTNIKKKRTGKK
jgi:DNA-binding transcriptional regulator YiaG